MGKNLKNADLVLRTGKVAFYLVPGNSAYTRMEGFTSLSTSKNPTEYERQYVDEDFKRTDITGYNTATSYALDRYKKHPVTDDIINIHENELLGQDAVRSIIQVDMTTVQEHGGIYTAQGKMRDYAVIPDADGDTTDCMTYSGNFKTRGEMEDVTVTTSDDWQTISIEGQTIPPYLTELSVTSGVSTIALSPEFSKDTVTYTLPTTNSVYNFYAKAESSSFSITLFDAGYQKDYGQGSLSSVGNTASTEKQFAIIVANGNLSRTYRINVVKESE